MTSVETLKKIYLFEKMTESELFWLSENSTEKDFVSGDAIFNEDSPAASMYVLLHGQVAILKKGEEHKQEIANLSPGTIFGEMAFIDGLNRAAYAQARDKVRVLEIPYFILQKKIDNDSVFGLKFYKALAVNLNRSIRLTTTDLASLKELKLRHH